MLENLGNMHVPFLVKKPPIQINSQEAHRWLPILQWRCHWKGLATDLDHQATRSEAKRRKIEKRRHCNRWCGWWPNLFLADWFMCHLLKWLSIGILPLIQGCYTQREGKRCWSSMKKSVFHPLTGGYFYSQNSAYRRSLNWKAGASQVTISVHS